MLGNKISGLVIIKDGLKAGDVIVSDGVQKLRDSSVIKTGMSEAPSQSSRAK